MEYSTPIRLYANVSPESKLSNRNKGTAGLILGFEKKNVTQTSDRKPSRGQNKSCY